MTQQTEEPKAQATEAPKPKLTIAEMKQAVCKKLQQIFSSPLMEERLSRMAGGDMSRVAKNLTSFLAVITEDDGGSKDNKKWYCQCSLTSLTMCFLESMNMQLPFDSRKLVSMVIYDWEVELDISYKGFIYALSKHYDNAYVDAKLVFNDDKFECEESGGKAVFTHVAKQPFRTIDKDFTNIAGGYCYFSYTVKSGEPISRIVRMSRDDIIMIKSKARTKNVWNDFPSEMGTKALIRRGSKIPFAAIDLDIDVEEVGNRHYDLAKPDSVAKLENLMKAQEEVVDDKKTQPKPEDKPTDNQNAGKADEAGTQAPQGGTENSGGDNAGGGTNAPANPQPANSIAPHEDEEPGDKIPAHITDADFEDMPDSPPALPTTGEAPVVTTVQPVVVALDGKIHGDWDGRTIFLGDGKFVSRDFNGADGALTYLKSVIARRNTKVSRKAIIEGNTPLIGALIKDGKGNAVADLHKLADEGK